MNWLERAECRDVDPELFFPPVGGEVGEAKAVCARCPVRDECLDWAIATPVTAGIFGGLTWQERKALRAERRRQPAA